MEFSIKAMMSKMVDIDGTGPSQLTHGELNLSFNWTGL